jgi:hypothetical protein
LGLVKVTFLSSLAKFLGKYLNIYNIKSMVLE